MHRNVADPLLVTNASANRRTPPCRRTPCIQPGRDQQHRCTQAHLSPNTLTLLMFNHVAPRNTSLAASITRDKLKFALLKMNVDSFLFILIRAGRKLKSFRARWSIRARNEFCDVR